MNRSLRILVIEDYDDFRNAICDVLSNDGHHVTGLAMAEDVDDEFIGQVSDLYIIDLNLPGEDGTSLAKRIRLAEPNAGIVIISARNSLNDRVNVYEAGANIYLTKPFSLDELRAVVSSFSKRRQLADEHYENALVVYSSRLLAIGPNGESRLTQSEVVLLAAFARATQQTLERWQIAAQYSEKEEISRENLDVKLGRLRKKIITCGIRAPAIQAVRSIGYKLCCPIKVMND